MAWFEQTAFYHIYPLGLTGAPEFNSYQEPVHRLAQIVPWIRHIRELGCSAVYIGPLFESGSHGYDTTDYRKVDSRLGTNEDLKQFVAYCHKEGIRVILDGVFNHTGRDFFAFRDIRQYRENSRYVNWYCNVNFHGNNEYHDGFSYDNWGGYNLLAKLNLRNPEVRDYLLNTVRFWTEQFDIDGLRLDAADVLDFDFMRSLRALAEEIKEDFWLMGEVIHGDYTRWVNEHTLHSVTNYHLHKALYSGHNDHNYFEIAHTVKRQMDMGLGRGISLYNFVDNHDVERIYTKLRQKEHFLPVHVLLYTLPGVPSIYYGSEFGVEGHKERGSDASLRPCLTLPQTAETAQYFCGIVRALGQIYRQESALWYGDYRELQLTTTKYAFSRGDLIITVNNALDPDSFDLPGEGSFVGALSGRKAEVEHGRLHLELDGCGGEIWIPEQRRRDVSDLIPDKPIVKQTGRPRKSKSEEQTRSLPRRAKTPKSYEEMTVEELQAEILAKMAANGPVTDRMKQDVLENVYPDSLRNWVRSFRN